MLDQTKVKRTVIILIFLAIVIFVGILIYSVASPAATCTDKKQNQGEKGIDCGGPCTPCKLTQTQDLVAQDTAVVLGGNNVYDVVAKVYNPNDTLGARNFKYVFTLKDASGAVVATKAGENFILPIDTKYVAELGISTEGNAAAVSAEISITEPVWTPLGGVEKPQLGVYNKKFDKAPMGDGSQVDGLLRNESKYDLNKILMVVVLKDASGKVVGINTTEKDVVRAGEQRDFRLNWPYALPGTVQKMEVDVQSNVLDPQNFTATQ